MDVCRPNTIRLTRCPWWMNVSASDAAALTPCSNRLSSPTRISMAGARIQDQADFGNLFLLKFAGKEFVGMARGLMPVK